MWNIATGNRATLPGMAIPFPDQFHFLQTDIEEVRKVVSADDKDPEDRMGLDEAFLEGVGQLEEFSGRKLMVVAALGGPHYLVRTAVGTRNTIFVVVDDRDAGKVVTKFYWDMTYYWCNFGMNMPGGCITTDRYARYDVYVSPRAAFVVIVGPTERCGTDRTTWFRSTKNAIPAAKLIWCHSWEVEVSPIVMAWVGSKATVLEIENRN